MNLSFALHNSLQIYNVHRKASFNSCHMHLVRETSDFISLLRKDRSILTCVSEFEKIVLKGMLEMSQSGPSFASIQKSAMKRDPACEHPAKVIFCDLLFSE